VSFVFEFEFALSAVRCAAPHPHRLGPPVAAMLKGRAAPPPPKSLEYETFLKRSVHLINGMAFWCNALAARSRR
jgi:hypothetical protein